MPSRKRRKQPFPGWLATESNARYLGPTINVVKNLGAVAADSFKSGVVDCPAGYQAIGGGVDPNGVFFGKVSQSAPRFGTSRLYSQPDGQIGPATGWTGAVSTQGTATGVTDAKISVTCSPIG